MSISRGALLRMIASYPERKVERQGLDWQGSPPGTEEFLYNLFPTEARNGVILTEDYAFCEDWRAIGGEIWLDPSIRLSHFGMHDFRGDPMEMFKRVEDTRAAARVA
jgi:hypothetical protein